DRRGHRALLHSRGAGGLGADAQRGARRLLLVLGARGGRAPLLAGAGRARPRAPLLDVHACTGAPRTPPSSRHANGEILACPCRLCAESVSRKLRAVLRTAAVALLAALGLAPAALAAGGYVEVVGPAGNVVAAGTGSTFDYP